MSVLTKATGHIHWKGWQSNGMYIRFPKMDPAGEYLSETNTSIYAAVFENKLVLTRLPAEDIAPSDETKIAYKDSSGGVRVYVAKRIILHLPGMQDRWRKSETFKFFGKYHPGAGTVLTLVDSFVVRRDAQHLALKD